MASLSAACALQAAVYTALCADDALIALLAPPAKFEGLPANTKLMLFDKVPDPVMQSFLSGGGVTYATLGEGTVRFELFGDPGDEDGSVEEERHSFTFHVWSQSVGLLEAKKIAAAISQALKDAFANKTFRLSGYTIANIDPVACGFDRTNDGFTSHASLTMSCLLQATT